MKSNFLTVQEFIDKREGKGHYLLGENFIWEALSDKGLVKVVNGKRCITSGHGHMAVEGDGELLFDEQVIKRAYEDYLEEIELEMDRLEWELEQL